MSWTKEKQQSAAPHRSFAPQPVPQPVPEPVIEEAPVQAPAEPPAGMDAEGTAHQVPESMEVTFDAEKILPKTPYYQEKAEAAQRPAAPAQRFTPAEEPKPKSLDDILEMIEGPRGGADR